MTDGQQRVEVLVIGAGFSGVCAGIRLDEAGVRDWLIVEKADGIGGTWWHNRYPGAACDIPSHLYSFSFEPNPDWTRLYSAQPEIRRYIERCVDTYGLRDRMRFARKLVALDWRADDGRWTARFDDGDTMDARFVINGSGGLHEPSWPRIEGMDSFAGKAMHTALWDESFDLSGAKVAVIGSAASAVQAVPELAKVAGRVTVFQRTPNYIAPRGDHAYDTSRQARYRRHPWLMQLHRWLIFMRLELTLFPIIRRPVIRSWLARAIKRHIARSIDDPVRERALTPDYEMGCKRILISDDFYETLRRDDVDLVTAPISHIQPEGVVTDDHTLHAADVLVYATGFDLGAHMRSIAITGEEGRRLSQDWADLAEAYQGVMIAGYPNYFMTTGPNTGVGTTSVVFMIEQTVGWIVKAIRATGDRHTLVVREAAQRAYNDRIQAELQKTVWASGCQSWYRRADGRIETLYPYNARAFRRQMSRLKRDDLIFRGMAGSRAT
ncbi:flavin-containing monooxygenase [Minwuia sp.]|uniref:flavin-containing monooxygenase n=1 Tax=Minwuia sp. TaxID=2493630 RepID=UPI003A8CB72A